MVTASRESGWLFLAGRRPLRPGGSRMHGGTAPAPRARALELSRDADEQVLAPVGGAELDADREAVGAPVERERDGRLPDDVEGHGEGDEGAAAREAAQGIVGCRVELAQAGRGLGERPGGQEGGAPPPPPPPPPPVRVPVLR